MKFGRLEKTEHELFIVGKLQGHNPLLAEPCNFIGNLNLYLKKELKSPRELKNVIAI